MIRRYAMLSVVALMALPLLTLAAEPVPPKTLGALEATLNFCSRVDTKSLDKYKEWGKMLVHDMSEKQVTEARGSGEYKETYDATTTELEKVPAKKAVEACRGFLTGSNK